MNTGLASVKLGYVPIRKFVFSQQDAARYKQLVEERLSAWGVQFVNIDGLTDDGMLYRHEDLPGVVEHLRREQVDALFCPHCNFGTEDVAALLGKEMQLPYLLWGPRDEMPLPDGTRLRDTQCGLFATSRILRRLNVPFTYIPNCRIDDPIFERGVRSFIQVASVVKAFRRLRIGQVGQRIDFFWTVMVNEAELLERFGIELFQIYATELVKRIRQLVDSPTTELIELVRKWRSQVAFEHLSDEQINAIAALKLVLGEYVAQHQLSGIALQCFPLLQEAFNIYPCFANSMLTMEGIPVTCETDIHGVISSTLLQAAALYESPTYFADLTIRHPENDNAELLWHCGPYPLSLADDSTSPKVGSHFILPGGAAGVCHWQIRKGDVTIARFDVDRGQYLLGFGEGRGTSGPETVGCYQWLEVADWLRWERKLIRGPYIHHVAGVHGHLAAVLHEACRYLPGVTPDPFDENDRELEEFWYRL
jgi:L-fucose isomerase-like protein